MIYIYMTYLRYVCDFNNILTQRPGSSLVRVGSFRLVGALLIHQPNTDYFSVGHKLILFNVIIF